MSLKDKAEAKAQQIVGGAEERIGAATGNDRVADQGREHQAEGRMKEVAADLTETVADTVDRAKEAAQDAADKVGRIFRK